MSEEHDCPHPVDWVFDEKGEITVWTCPECGMVWGAHYDIYWAPIEDGHGKPIRAVIDTDK